ncbi:probable glycerol-3-phosphate acyltransferase 2 [Arachis stenosperma]|uniref:probable glycerol-3-phosphate acyltransferase 2 n=1 Tax=Arachis stenosperma TaxID=217475 RepID=UPI0025ABB079|nr:probable glycerol-3-phosphate acyltransferase 2 [Arachis stenosperma]
MVEMAKMFTIQFFFKSLFFFWYRFFFKPLKNFQRTNSISYITTTIATTQSSFNKYRKFSSYSSSLLHRSDLKEHTLLFDVEGALLRSSSVFPYFMLVAFEAGGLVRAIVLVLTYPLVCLVGEDLGMKIMVMVCFFGIKEKSFRVGSAVLPKFLLEDVGSEIFEVVNGAGKRVGLSKMPRVMVECFLKEYLKVDLVVGREMKEFCGYFLGFMEERKNNNNALELVQEGKGSCSSNIIGISGFRNKDFRHHEIFSRCKEVYLVSDGDKKSWQKLSRNKYPKSLIFHDGRLALRPTPLDSLVILTWFPFAVVLAFVRIVAGLTLPFDISIPLLALTGMRLDSSLPAQTNEHAYNNEEKVKGNMYVCNHRTLLDPLYLSFLLRKKVVAVTYSLSRMSEILAPIKTVRLTRKREEDARMMKELLMEGDLVVCPEGTTCREPYLLRFSPLFSELCDEISPVAIDSHVSMFHGTTAGGLKCMDPLFFLMNPFPSYSVHLLHTVTTSSSSDDDDNVSRFEVANRVQSQIAEALGFQCTKLTRKDKYLILAGNEGIVSSSSNK